MIKNEWSTHKRPAKCQVGDRARVRSVRVRGGFARSRCYTQGVGCGAEKGDRNGKAYSSVGGGGWSAGQLEKKFDKAGGTITGDMRVTGNARMKNLSIEEYLEVPELKYNRITATGNEFWVTDAGVIDDVLDDDDGIFLITLKEKPGEVTINFQYKDILRGIFYTQDENGKPTGFKTAYFEVTGIIDDIHFDCISLNGVLPERFMTLARQGNKTNPKRQGSIYLDGLHKFIRITDKVTDDKIEQSNIKVQLGDLSEINHPVFGQLEGYGALLENAYICGRLVQRNPDTGEDWIVGAVSVQGEQMFRYKDNIPEPATITLTAIELGITSPERLHFLH